METNPLIDNSNPHYSGTLDKLEELKDLIEELEERFAGQIGQGLANEFTLATKPFLEWVAEIEATLTEYCENYRT